PENLRVCDLIPPHDAVTAQIGTVETGVIEKLRGNLRPGFNLGAVELRKTSQIEIVIARNVATKQSPTK
ncbi:MAG: hypothetical protein V2B18_05045, partial [Pseudomonadota bacterium]